MPAPHSDDSIRQAVRETYAAVAASASSGCCGPVSCCSGDSSMPVAIDSTRLGYSLIELQSVPEGSEMGLGCGNPQAIAALQAGETVLDLGSGGGFDCFLASKQVGASGHVIGVDMTPEMLERARQNAANGGYANVEFRQGLIEDLPVEDGTVDVILSNCVVNLSPDKAKVYREAYRVLKPGGRLAISDMVALMTLPSEAQQELSLYSACIAGAATIDENKALLEAAGFRDVDISSHAKESQEMVQGWAPGTGLEAYVASAMIRATKPEA